MMIFLGNGNFSGRLESDRDMIRQRYYHQVCSLRFDLDSVRLKPFTLPTAERGLGFLFLPLLKNQSTAS